MTERRPLVTVTGQTQEIAAGDTISPDLLTPEVAPYTEMTYTSGRLTAVTTWTSPAKTIKIEEVLLTYTAALVTQVVDNVYNDTGTTIVQTVTSVITYSGGRIFSITETIT